MPAQPDSQDDSPPSLPDLAMWARFLVWGSTPRSVFTTSRARSEWGRKARQFLIYLNTEVGEG